MLYGKVLRAARLRREADGHRPGPGQGDEGRGRRAGRTSSWAWPRRRPSRPSRPWPPSPRRRSGSASRIRRARTSSPTSKQSARGGLPANPFQEELAQAKQVLRQTYHVAYVQHAPLEPRAAVAEWADGKLTVWTGSQNPFGCRSELARAFHLPDDHVRVIVPDFGGGFGGKHTGEAAVEAARLAQAAGSPVSLRWTRAEEFTWAYFRPAALIDVEASLDGQGSLTSWHFININSGGSAVDTPYRAGKKSCQFVGADAPLRHGSYRALAATANNFARESFMDELAAAAGADPLDSAWPTWRTPACAPSWRPPPSVLTGRKPSGKRPRTSAWAWPAGPRRAPTWPPARRSRSDEAESKLVVRRVCQVFECGAILNPDNLLSQVQGAIIMGLGPALREEMRFENGEILNASFRSTWRRASRMCPNWTSTSSIAPTSTRRRRRNTHHCHRPRRRQCTLPRNRTPRADDAPVGDA